MLQKCTGQNLLQRCVGQLISRIYHVFNVCVLLQVYNFVIIFSAQITNNFTHQCINSHEELL